MRDALGLGGVGEERGIEGVVGMGIDDLDGEEAVRALVLVLGDGAGKEGDDLAAGVERLDAGFREENAERGGLGNRRGGKDLRPDDFGAGDGRGDAGVERLQIAARAVEFLGEQFPDVVIAEARRLALGDPRRAAWA